MNPMAAQIWMQRAIQVSLLVITGLLLMPRLRPAPAWQPPTIAPVASRPAALESAPRPRLDPARLAQRNLRQPPVDPPPPVAVPSPEAPLGFQLAGTVVEPQRRFAVFTLAGGSTIRELGGTIAGHEVVAVERGWVRLRRGAREIELRVPWYDRIVAENSARSGLP